MKEGHIDEPSVIKREDKEIPTEDTDKHDYGGENMA